MHRRVIVGGQRVRDYDDAYARCGEVLPEFDAGLHRHEVRSNDQHFGLCFFSGC